MKDKFKLLYMDIADRVSLCSSANRLKVGCICVQNNRIISIGYNGTPSGWDNCCEDENNNTKEEVIHAEQNMLAKLCRSTDSSEGSSVFITHSPCLNCSKIIYQAGIKEVYYRNEYRIKDGINFLEKCGIKIEKIN